MPSSPAASYEDLRVWSTEHYDKFWEEFFHYSGILHSAPYSEVCPSSLRLPIVQYSTLSPLWQVVDMTKEITDIPKWFQDCKLNYAENLLKCPNGNKVALITYGRCLLSAQWYGLPLKHYLLPFR